jgi:hypothetical protein
MGDYDDDEFSDFMSRVNDVTATIEGLKTGTVDAKALVEADEARLREDRERQAKRERKAEQARMQVEARSREAERMARLRDENKDELEVRAARESEAQPAVAMRSLTTTSQLASPQSPDTLGAQALKRDYYLRKAKRERWEAFRDEQHSKAANGKGFSDYYRGWDLFEEDPDEGASSQDCSHCTHSGPGSLDEGASSARLMPATSTSAHTPLQAHPSSFLPSPQICFQFTAHTHTPS